MTTFRGALAVRDDGEIVVALFNGNPMRCVGMWKASMEAATALYEVLGSALLEDN